jgi:oxygen-independent coproporphyrinogen III oxidase
MPMGVYISVPFCPSKCSYCNFASGVFSHTVFDRYVERLCANIEDFHETVTQMGGKMEREVDSIYLGGGTPTVLQSSQLERIFGSIKRVFHFSRNAEITVECAPGTLGGPMIESLVSCGVNRVSLGVQSFVDQESAAVGRMHKRETVLRDVARLRSEGITNINLDLIAGLPHQTAQSWDFSIGEAIATRAQHISVYMLEVDEDSRLGRELIAGGTRYHAHFVPDEEAVAAFYIAACDRLRAAGIAQYEISNFACGGFESRHNLKYWTRQPYVGFGVDAHSMLLSAKPGVGAVRFAFPDSLEQYAKGAELTCTAVSDREALEECFFLGLRLTHGINFAELAAKFGDEAVEPFRLTVAELIESQLLEKQGHLIRLTSRGQLLSNEVFERFIVTDKVLT